MRHLQALFRRGSHSSPKSSSSPIGFVARLQYVRVVTCSISCIPPESVYSLASIQANLVSGAGIGVG